METGTFVNWQFGMTLIVAWPLPYGCCCECRSRGSGGARKAMSSTPTMAREVGDRKIGGRVPGQWVE